MKIIPVLDLKNKMVVRGVGGRREEYQPIASTLNPLAEPRAVAKTLARIFGFNEFYLADLDAIGGEKPCLSLYQELRTWNFSLWVDAGIRDLTDAQRLADEGIDFVVVGLETLKAKEELGLIVDSLGPDRVVFSLDLKQGKPLGNLASWETEEAYSIAKKAVALGIWQILLLDLSRVGTDSGPGTNELCAQLKEDFAHIKIFTGGGVRGMADLEKLQGCGVDGTLVASALHDGRLTPAEVRRFL